jgi:hypothetical protein
MGTDKEGYQVKDECHPSHKTRSSDASSFDEICILCGATDFAGGGWGNLRFQCKAVKEETMPIKVVHKQHTGAMEDIFIKPKTLNDYAKDCHAANDKWWTDINTGERLVRNKGELLALIHSEISEVLEGVRKNKMDDHLPHRKAEEVEIVDALIRIFDYAGAYSLDIEGAYHEKMSYNKVRSDHSHDARKAEGGKAF